MADDILMLIKLDTDTIAHLSFILSIVAVIVSLVSALGSVNTTGQDGVFSQ